MDKNNIESSLPEQYGRHFQDDIFQCIIHTYISGSELYLHTILLGINRSCHAMFACGSNKWYVHGKHSQLIYHELAIV